MALVAVAIGCQGEASEAQPKPEPTPDVAHEQAIEEMRNLGARLDIEETTYGTTGVKLDFRNTKLNDDGLSKIKALGSITELYLNQTQITDKGLAQLAGLNELRRLYLSGTAITDAGLKSLGTLHNIEVITLQDTQVTAAGVKELQQALPRAHIVR